MTPQQRYNLLKSIERANPNLYRNAIITFKSQVMGNRLGDVTQDVVATTQAVSENQSWFDKLLAAFPDLLKTGLLVKNQNDLNRINLELVKQGKPPLSSDAIGTVVNVGIAAETRKVLIYTAAGLGVLLAVVLLKKR